jgi:hypothetical protein
MIDSTDIIEVIVIEAATCCPECDCDGGDCPPDCC